MRVNMASFFCRLGCELFVSQRDQRIDAYRAARRNIASEQRDTDEENRDARECERVCGADSEQPGRDQM